jgi:hypothetical protein
LRSLKIHRVNNEVKVLLMKNIKNMLMNGTHNLIMKHLTSKAIVRSLAAIVMLSACSTVSANLIGNWTGDGNALDSVGSVNGTLMGNAGYATGIYDQAFNFDGAGDYVELGSDSSLKFTGSMTMSAWINPTAYSEYQIILNYENAYEVAIANGNIQYAFWNSSPGWTWIDTGLSVALNEWTGFSISYDGSSINTYDGAGTLVHSIAGSGNIQASPNTLRIGARSGPSAYFNGLIDDVRLYDTSISGIETPVAVPEPLNFILMSLGLAGLAFRKYQNTQT